jgi:hypothetical protein
MSEDLLQRMRTTAHLGRDFLTWLWFKSDTQEGLVKVGENTATAEIWFTDRVVLSTHGDLPERVAINTDDPSGNAEARTALRQGKKVDQARLRIVKDQREWLVTVKSESLALGAIKIPQLLTKEEDDQIRERLVFLDQLDSITVSLFKRFIALRNDNSRWDDTCAAMATWINSPLREQH